MQTAAISKMMWQTWYGGIHTTQPTKLCSKGGTCMNQFIMVCAQDAEFPWHARQRPSKYYNFEQVIEAIVNLHFWLYLYIFFVMMPFFYPTMCCNPVSSDQFFVCCILNITNRGMLYSLSCIRQSNQHSVVWM